MSYLYLTSLNTNSQYYAKYLPHDIWWLPEISYKLSESESLIAFLSEDIKKDHGFVTLVNISSQAESDLSKALNLCHQRGWNDILVDGIEGGRHDHLLGGLAALAGAHPSLNIRANLPSTKLTRFVTGFSDNITLSGTFSVFSFGTSNVTLLGPEWELNNDDVTFSTRGLSNLGNGESELTIHSGDPLFLLINL